jgi:bacterioferritin-associated ferredoxin
MIICSCNVITDHDVRKVIDLESPPSAVEVYVYLGRRARCGRCAPTIRRIVAEPMSTPSTPSRSSVTTSAGERFFSSQV